MAAGTSAAGLGLGSREPARGGEPELGRLERNRQLLHAGPPDPGCQPLHDRGAADGVGCPCGLREGNRSSRPPLHRGTAAGCGSDSGAGDDPRRAASRRGDSVSQRRSGVRAGIGRLRAGGELQAARLIEGKPSESVFRQGPVHFRSAPLSDVPGCPAGCLRRCGREEDDRPVNRCFQSRDLRV